MTKEDRASLRSSLEHASHNYICYDFRIQMVNLLDDCDESDKRLAAMREALELIRTGRKCFGEAQGGRGCCLEEQGAPSAAAMAACADAALAADAGKKEVG